MYLVRLGLLLSVIMLLSGVTLAVAESGGVKPETAALYQKARDQVARLSTTQAAIYAPEMIRQATESVEIAQNGLRDGNDQITRQASELAATKARLALALTDERIATEKTAAAQKELKELEQRLASILAGKGEKP